MFCLLSAKIYNKSDNNNVWRGIILIVFILQLILFSINASCPFS